MWCGLWLDMTFRNLKADLLHRYLTPLASLSLQCLLVSVHVFVRKLRKWLAGFEPASLSDSSKGNRCDTALPTGNAMDLSLCVSCWGVDAGVKEGMEGYVRSVLRTDGFGDAVPTAAQVDHEA